MDERQPKADAKPMTLHDSVRPLGGAKDTVSNPSKFGLQEAARSMSWQENDKRMEQRAGERNSERETIFIMERRSPSGKRNYGQTVAAA